MGRATKEFEGVELATESVALQAARRYLKNTLVNMDLDRDVIMDCKLGTGSSDLRDVFKRDRVPIANDTSFGVGHAPFSELETSCLQYRKATSHRPEITHSWNRRGYEGHGIEGWGRYNPYNMQWHDWEIYRRLEQLYKYH